MVNKKNIRLFKPSVGNDEILEIKKVFKKSWIGYGQRTREFEQLWSKYFKVKYSVGTNSCTAALHVVLAAQNFKKGKKVLVPSITFSASAAAPLYCGLKPVFVDIDKNSLTMNFDDLKKKYDKNCVAVIPVHFGGHPCEMDKITKWAKKKKLLVIEDCAETCGSSYKGKKLGTWGDYGCFSFEEKKILTTGDGGMITTNIKKNLDKIRSLSFHGWDKDPLKRFKISKSKNIKNNKHWMYNISNLGFKYNMNDLMASIGIAQFKKLKIFNLKREIIVKRYLKGLKNCKGIVPAFPYNPKNSSYWMFSIKCKKRDFLSSFLQSRGISTSVHLIPLPLQPLYKKFNSNTPVAIRTWKQLLTLPLFPDLKLKDVDYVISQVKKFNDLYLSKDRKSRI
jgi:perosamine synthetase